MASQLVGGLTLKFTTVPSARVVCSAWFTWANAVVLMATHQASSRRERANVLIFIGEDSSSQTVRSGTFIRLLLIANPKFEVVYRHVFTASCSTSCRVVSSWGRVRENKRKGNNPTAHGCLILLG